MSLALACGGAGAQVSIYMGGVVPLDLTLSGCGFLTSILLLAA